MASVFELAKQYYPRLWDKYRIEALVEVGRLTEKEAQEILGRDDTQNGAEEAIEEEAVSKHTEEEKEQEGAEK